MTEENTPQINIGYMLRVLLFEVALPAAVTGVVWIKLGMAIAAYTDSALLAVPVTAAVSGIAGMATLLLVRAVTAQ